MKKSRFALGLTAGFMIVFVHGAHAGMRMDLRPVGLTVHPPDAMHSLPFVAAGDWQANTDYMVNVYLVDTGNPQGAIPFRGLFLDTVDSAGLTFMPNNFNWAFPTGIGSTFPSLPNTSWVYPLPIPEPLFQPTLPDDGELFIGDMGIRVVGNGGFLDLTNHDEPNDNFGARADFGFGGAGDPVTTWRAFTGEITGGMLEFAVPEPATIAILAISAVYFLRARGGKT